uniref:Uncharacterized protein n=1 Tax=Romanomermis culicivorax TaxID=13658 RepID=A0A915J029_ROMCU
MMAVINEKVKLKHIFVQLWMINGDLYVGQQGTGMRSTQFFGKGCWRSRGDSQLFSINRGGQEPGTDEQQ